MTMRWCGLTRPTRACCKADNVARGCPRARSANTVASASPPSTASSIAPARAQDSGGDRRHREVGRLEHRPPPLDVGGALRDQRRARARQCAQVADGNRRHKAGASDTMAREIGDPCGVGHVWTCARTRSVWGKIVFGTQTRRKKNGSSHVTGSSHGPDLARHACPQHLLSNRGACAIVGAHHGPGPRR